jgi:CubicO group peptidase (beta-lactamase class C family)
MVFSLGMTLTATGARVGLVVAVGALCGVATAGAGTGTRASDFEGVRAEIVETIERTGVASVAVAVSQGGEVVWAEGFGWADRDREIGATPSTVYHLASISKSMTATALMILVERGLVDLDRPANDYLGESKLNALVGDASEATVSRLVFHTAGLPTHWNLLPFEGPHRRPGMDESIGRYGILASPPGEAYTYSNFGYGILEYIISRVSGREYADFMRDEVFEPLGMTSTWVQVDGAPRDDVAVIYDANGEAIAPYDFDHRGASAVVASAHDLVRFGMFHMGVLPGQRKAILEDKTFRRMHEEVGSTFTEDGGSDVDYLLGSLAGVDSKGYRLWVTSGGMVGAASRLVLAPEMGVAIATVANGGNIELWRIETSILNVMLPGYADAATNGEDDSDEESRVREPSDAFVGAWAGEIATHAGPLAVDVVFHENGRVNLKIEGEYTPPVGVRTALGEMGFKGDTYRDLFMGRIDTPDATRSIHAVLIECRLRGRRLVGTASAVAMNEYFCLPYGMVLVPAE